MRSDRPRVIYIMGSGRSGTTLLGSILGEFNGIFGAGEVSYLWERGILEPRGCGCGRPPMQCPVWGPVIERIAAGRDPRDLAREQLLLRQHLRLCHTGRLVKGAPIEPTLRIGEASGPGERAATQYGLMLEDVYLALAQQTGCPTIVDTSKHPADAAVLGRLTRVDSTFVHVVRDPRAVTHSWRRRKQGIARRKTVLAALDWEATNRAADAVRRRHSQASLLLRYEGLMAGPAEQVARVLSRAGLPSEPTPFSGPNIVNLTVNHTVSGNPDRFVAGPTIIRLDDRWQREMSVPLRVLVTALTTVGLRRYGYPVRT